VPDVRADRGSEIGTGVAMHFHPPLSNRAASAYAKARKCYGRRDFQGAAHFQQQAAELHAQSIAYDCVCGRCGGKCEMWEMGAVTTVVWNPTEPPPGGQLSEESAAQLWTGLADVRAGRVVPLDLSVLCEEE